jgi:hypothetical protein
MLSAHVANNSLRLDDEKVLTILQSSFIHMSPKMRQSDDEIQVILAEEIKNLDSLEYSLKGLERLAKNCNVNVIFHVEDFQEICIADDGIQIESIFRECVEDAEHTTFVFSGSDDSILTSAFFSDRRRPLYLHLETVELDKL